MTIGGSRLIWLGIEWGRPGWYVVGAMFALTGAAAPVAVRRGALRSASGRRG